MIEPLQANWQNLSDKDVVGLLRNSEGKNSTDRALFLEAARRIEAQDAAIAAAVQAEREACAKLASNAAYDMAYTDDAHCYAMAGKDIAAAIRARNGEGRE